MIATNYKNTLMDEKRDFLDYLKNNPSSSIDNVKKIFSVSLVNRHFLSFLKKVKNDK